MNSLPRDEIAEPVSRDQILRRERGQGKRLLKATVYTKEKSSSSRPAMVVVGIDRHIRIAFVMLDRPNQVEYHIETGIIW